ncbi:hypothetical protein [Streptomyces sp. DSM 40750]|uniref:hypothetical protein n=1 Tax=Streptomyces sp. DSM 40750 TaxID=2801030 RepID=UPI0027D45B2B|nr:hypothetical protein [Streptomyces sp. DSM 40750]
MLGGGFGGRTGVVTALGAVHQEPRAPLVRGPSPVSITAVLPYAAERAAALVDGFVLELLR